MQKYLRPWFVAFFCLLLVFAWAAWLLGPDIAYNHAELDSLQQTLNTIKTEHQTKTDQLTAEIASLRLKIEFAEIELARHRPVKAELADFFQSVSRRLQADLQENRPKLVNASLHPGGL